MCDDVHVHPSLLASWGTCIALVPASGFDIPSLAVHSCAGFTGSISDLVVRSFAHAIVECSLLSLSLTKA